MSDKPSDRRSRRRPDFEDYATVEAYCQGVPVYSLGNIAYIYGVSPDLLPGARLQEGNARPMVKIAPKKSWEIKSNPYGVTICEPGPRSRWNDAQPLLPIHLIDGDPRTAWSSYGSSVPDERPEWIRIDLPAETTITAVALVCSADFAQRGLYKEGKLLDRMGYHEWAARALPGELTVQTSRDAWHWETLYENGTFAGNEDGATVIPVKPHRAKQILITGRNFKRKLSKYDGYCFSISGVEVRDEAGQNLALVSRGAGVTVSSTSSLMDHDRFTQGHLFGPVQYDLGLKWIRIGADNGMLTWNCVEREKGMMQIDPVADALVTEMHRNGVGVIMNLDVKANWNYRGEKFGEIKDPKKYEQGYGVSADYVYRGEKPSWNLARIYELNNIYYDFPGWAYETEEMFQGYLRYVDFMVRHFKGKVAYYEVGNEWGGNREVYARAVRAIKQIDPRAKIMVCVFRMTEFVQLLTEWKEACSPDELALLMPDAVGSHPNTRMDAGLTLDDLHTFYWQENREAMRAARKLGYKGVFIASEVYSWSLYPPGPLEIDVSRPGISNQFGTSINDPVFCGESEIVRAKYIAQNFIGHAGLGMMAFQCNTYFVSCPVGQSLFRVTVPSQVLNPVQPDAGYYVFRTICTVMDGWKGQEFPVEFTAGTAFESFTFRRGRTEAMVAAWIPGNTVDGVVEARTDVIVPGFTAKAVRAINLFNGTEQDLDFSVETGCTVLKGILAKDYPLLLQFVS